MCLTTANLTLCFTSCVFATSEDCSECTSLLRERSGLPSSTKALFAYRFYSQACLKEAMKVSLTPEEAKQVALCRRGKQTFDVVVQL